MTAKGIPARSGPFPSLSVLVHEAARRSLRFDTPRSAATCDAASLELKPCAKRQIERGNDCLVVGGRGLLKRSLKHKHNLAFGRSSWTTATNSPSVAAHKLFVQLRQLPRNHRPSLSSTNTEPGRRKVAAIRFGDSYSTQVRCSSRELLQTARLARRRAVAKNPRTQKRSTGEIRYPPAPRSLPLGQARPLPRNRPPRPRLPSADLDRRLPACRSQTPTRPCVPRRSTRPPRPTLRPRYEHRLVARLSPEPRCGSTAGLFDACPHNRQAPLQSVLLSP